MPSNEREGGEKKEAFSSPGASLATRRTPHLRRRRRGCRRKGESSSGEEREREESLQTFSRKGKESPPRRLHKENGGRGNVSHQRPTVGRGQKAFAREIFLILSVFFHCWNISNYTLRGNCRLVSRTRHSTAAAPLR